MRTTSSDDRQSEAGFTLVELLVVMLIIGILAAIAIPSFLAQKSKAYDAAIKSDLKSGAIAEAAYATDHNGLYVAEVFKGPAPATGVATDISSTTADLLAQQGMRASIGVTITATVTTTTSAADTYCLVGTSTAGTGSWYLSSKDNIPTRGSACP